MPAAVIEAAQRFSERLNRTALFTKNLKVIRISRPFRSVYNVQLVSSSEALFLDSCTRTMYLSRWIYIYIHVALFCVIVQTQKCIRDSSDGFNVICRELMSFTDLREELAPSWRQLAVVNSQQKRFELDARYVRERNFIETLDLSQVGALIVQDDGFSSFESLQYLNISGVHLEALKSDDFAADNIIETFDASWNELRLLSPELRWRLRKMRFANFSHNALYNLDGGGCDIFTHLEHLNLDNNEFKVINIADCPKLRYLSLKDNLIELLFANHIQHMPALTELHMSANYLRSIEAGSFETLPALSLLNLSENSLPLLMPEVFRGLGELLSLDLHSNNLKTLVARQFQHLEKLQRLDLSANSIAEVNSDSFSGLTKLRKLYLQQNDIVSIAAHTFNNLKSLDSLDLSQNSLTHLDAQSFGTAILPRLGKLNLNVNNLESLNLFVFSPLPFLWYLSLGNNALTKLDMRMFAPMRLLRKLHLGNNQLEFIAPELLDTLGDIAELLIDNNKLTYLPNVNTTFPNLRKITLEGNPWQCLCFFEILNWLHANRVDYLRANSPYYQGERPICVVTSLDYCVQNVQWQYRDTVVDEYEREE